jgi:hypothetical protein
VPLDFQADHSHQLDAIARRYDAVAESEVEAHFAIFYSFFEMHVAKRVGAGAVPNGCQCKIVRADQANCSGGYQRVRDSRRSC